MLLAAAVMWWWWRRRRTTGPDDASLVDDTKLASEPDTVVDGDPKVAPPSSWEEDSASALPPFGQLSDQATSVLPAQVRRPTALREHPGRSRSVLSRNLRQGHWSTRQPCYVTSHSPAMETAPWSTRRHSFLETDQRRGLNQCLGRRWFSTSRTPRMYPRSR